MKRILLLTAIICAYGINATFAQTNLDLEAWSPVGVGAENPDDWGSLNEFTLFGFPQSTFKETTDPGQGTASARLESQHMPGASGAGAPSDTVGGMLFLGGYNLQTGLNGIAYTQKPVSIDFIYKANPLGTDTGAILVILSHWDGAQTVVDAQGLMFFPNQVTTWTAGSISPFYFTADIPDTLKIIAASSSIMLGLEARGMEVPGSQLFLDKFVINLPGDPLTIFSTSWGDETCFGTCDGWATVTASAGVEPYSYLWDDGNAQTTLTATGLCAGNYSVRVIDANNDTLMASGVVGGPTAALTATSSSTPDTASGSNGTASVSASGGTSPYAYSWSNGDSTAAIANLAAADYTVTITDANGCTFMSTVTVGAVTGIGEIGGNVNIKVYPNPAVNELNIVTTFNGKTAFDIFDILGKQIKSVAIRGDITRVSIAELPEGMYLYQIIDDKGAVLSKGKFNIVR